MAKPNDAELLTRALENITIQELLDLNEDDTYRLAMAFEGFVDKIGEVVKRVSQTNRRLVH